jgi:hypothetical protein
VIIVELAIRLGAILLPIARVASSDRVEDVFVRIINQSTSTGMLGQLFIRLRSMGKASKGLQEKLTAIS